MHMFIIISYRYCAGLTFKFMVMYIMGVSTEIYFMDMTIAISVASPQLHTKSIIHISYVNNMELCLCNNIFKPLLLLITNISKYQLIYLLYKNHSVYHMDGGLKTNPPSIAMGIPINQTLVTSRIKVALVYRHSQITAINSVLIILKGIYIAKTVIQSLTYPNTSSDTSNIEATGS